MFRLETKKTQERAGEPKVERARERLPFRLAQFRKYHVDIFNLGGFDPGLELAEVGKTAKWTPATMEDFRKKLAMFRRELSAAQVEMEELLRENPDIEQGELERQVNLIIKKHGVESHEYSFSMAADIYLRKHKEVRDTIKTYQQKHGGAWQVELFKDLFDFLPRGGITIDVMPISIYIRIENKEDFAGACTANKEYYKKKDARVSKDINFWAVALPRDGVMVAPLQGKVLIENSSKVRLEGPKYDHDYERASSFLHVHEEEHAIHQNIYLSRGILSFEHAYLDLLKNGARLEQFVRTLRAFARVQVRSIQEGGGATKEEILAYVKENRITLARLKEKMIVEKDYDYLINWGFDSAFVEAVAGHFRRGMAKIEKQDGSFLIEQEVREIALKTIMDVWNLEYKPMVSRAIDIVEKMLARYSDQPDGRMKVVRLLIQEPLSRWHRLEKILSDKPQNVSAEKEKAKAVAVGQAQDSS